MVRSARSLSALLLLLGSVSCSTEEAGCAREEVESDAGLLYEDIACGAGDQAGRGDRVTVLYSAELLDGTVVESRTDEPLTTRLGVGTLIEGWDDGISGMKAEGVRRLTVPPDLGYGGSGLPPHVPPDATLVFEIELIEIEPI